MRAVVTDAERTDATVPGAIPASVVVWVVWADYLDGWAEMQ
jgi:hypothetical protein